MTDPEGPSGVPLASPEPPSRLFGLQISLFLTLFFTLNCSPFLLSPFMAPPPSFVSPFRLQEALFAPLLCILGHPSGLNLAILT